METHRVSAVCLAFAEGRNSDHGVSQSHLRRPDRGVSQFAEEWDPDGRGADIVIDEDEEIPLTTKDTEELARGGAFTAANDLGTESTAEL
jgi:hypothetical protein